MDLHQMGEPSGQSVRPLSAPPAPHLKYGSVVPPNIYESGRAGSDFYSGQSHKENILAAHLDIMPALQRSAPSVVKSRNGSVLSRGFILKTDHYPSGEQQFLLSAVCDKRGTRSILQCGCDPENCRFV